MTGSSEFIPQHVRQFLETQDNTISAGLDFICSLDDDQGFSNADARLESTEKTARILRGFLYIRYRETCDGRKFLSFLAARGVAQRTAYDYITEAQLYARLPSAEACAIVATIGQVKTRLLSPLGDDVLNDFLAGKPVLGVTPDEATLMTKEEFKAKIKEYEQSMNGEFLKQAKTIQTLSAELESTQLEKQSLQQQLIQRTDHNQFPDFVMATRQESTAMADKSLLCLDDLSRLDNELHDLVATADKQDVNVALNSLFIHVNAVAAHAQSVVVAMRDRWGDALQPQPTGDALYSDAELADIAATRELLIRDHEQEKRLRAHQRDDVKPRGRGRPKKK